MASSKKVSSMRLTDPTTLQTCWHPDLGFASLWLFGGNPVVYNPVIRTNEENRCRKNCALCCWEIVNKPDDGIAGHFCPLGGARGDRKQSLAAGKIQEGFQAQPRGCPPAASPADWSKGRGVNLKWTNKQQGKATPSTKKSNPISVWNWRICFCESSKLWTLEKKRGLKEHLGHTLA